MSEKRILIVDDDRIFRGRLARILEQKGFEVVEASSTNEALKAAGIEVFHGVVLDLNMPGSSGLSAIPEIKRLQPEARLVVLTGYGSVHNAAHAFKSGASDFLTKPVSISDLIASIDGISSNKSTQVVDYPKLHEMERDYLNRVLIDCEGNITRAAKFLGLHRRSLQRKLAKMA